MTRTDTNLPTVPIVLGITGHRSLRQQDLETLTLRITEVIREFQLAYPHTPITLLTSLAPGADQLAVAAATDLQDRRNVDVRAAIPFPREIYADSSSFGVGPEKKPSNEERTARDTMLKWTAPGSGIEVFVIPMPGGPATTGDAASLRAWEAYRDDDVLRRSCYTNCGAYIARHCHAMIALWDGSDPRGPGGTAELVRFKLHGERPALHPDPALLGAGGDTGPVYVIHTPRPGTTSNRPAGELAVHFGKDLIWPTAQPRRRAGRISRWCRRLLGQFGLPAHHKPSSQDELLSAEWRQFHNTCQAVDDFNRDVRSLPRSQDGANGDESAADAAALANFLKSTGLPANLAPPAIGSLARVRSAAAALSRRLEPRVAWLLRGLFLLMFAFAVCFHVYAHVFAVHDGHPLHAPKWMAAALWALAVALFLTQFVAYRRMDTRRLDYRALAEALRVRCWWAMAGVPASVSDTYLHQFRGEMSWARRALSTISPPPRMWSEGFEALPPADRQRLLVAVRDGWVKDQARQYHKSSHRNERKAVTLRRLGFGLALLGWLSALALLVWPAASHPTPAEHPSAWVIIGIGLAVLLGGLLFAYQERRSHEELAKLYERMAVLFDRGYEDLVSRLNKKDFTTADESVARGVIEQLGREAIAENAQWLVLRRSRPFEPPLG